MTTLLQFSNQTCKYYYIPYLQEEQKKPGVPEYAVHCRAKSRVASGTLQLPDAVLIAPMPYSLLLSCVNGELKLVWCDCNKCKWGQGLKTTEGRVPLKKNKDSFKNESSPDSSLSSLIPNSLWVLSKRWIMWLPPDAPR